MRPFKVLRKSFVEKLLYKNTLTKDMKNKENIQEYKIVLQRMVSGCNARGKRINIAHRQIKGMSILGIIIEYLSMNSGVTAMTPINKRFLFPAPKAKDGDIANSIIKTVTIILLLIVQFILKCKKIFFLYV